MGWLWLQLSTGGSGSSTRPPQPLSYTQAEVGVFRETLAQDFSVNTIQERMLSGSFQNSVRVKSVSETLWEGAQVLIQDFGHKLKIKFQS